MCARESSRAYHARVALLEENLLARHADDRADVLAEDLDGVKVGVLPVALGHVEKVHERVVPAHIHVHARVRDQKNEHMGMHAAEIEKVQERIVVTWSR